MKKIKSISLLALLLTLVVVLVSCGVGTVSLSKILNAEHDPSEDVYVTSKALAELNGYTMTKANDSFVLFTSSSASLTTYKVLSLESGEILNTFTDLPDIFYEIDLPAKLPFFTVKKVEYTDPTLTEAKSTYYLYDTTGESVKSTTYAVADPFMLTDDVLVYDYTTYSVGKDGVLTKKSDIPEFLLMDDLDSYNDKYYYTLSSYSVAVYDHSFNLLSTYSTPDYVDDATIEILNNGDIFVQYTYEVDEDSKKFDIDASENGKSQKLNLVSLIVSAKTGKTTPLKLDYVVLSLASNYDLRAMYDNDGSLTDKFENLAIIAPIVNKKIDTSNNNLDIVTINNKAKIQKSLKFLENQNVSLPTMIANDRYAVSMLDGSTAVINSKGNLITLMNNYISAVGDYFVGERAIYDLNLSKVYDLSEKGATVLDTVDNTVFVKVNTDTGYDVILFCDGSEKMVYSYAKDGSTTAVFNIVEDFGYTITDPASGDHKYYNANGDLLITTAYELTVTAKSSEYDTLLLSGSDNGALVYHTFTTKS